LFLCHDVILYTTLFRSLVSIVDIKGQFSGFLLIIETRNLVVPFMMGDFKMEMLTIEEATLRSVQTFESVAAMNEAVKAYKQEYALSQTDIAILDAISRYACKYTGVCFLSKQGIAEEAGFTSRRTAIRACNRMEKLGMMKQYETRRVSGDKRQSANIIVIQPVEFEDNFLDGKSEISATKCDR